MGFVAVPARGRRVFKGHLAPGEHFIVLGRRHWASIAEPVGTTVVSFFLIIALWWQYEQTEHRDGSVLGIIWLFIAARGLWHFAQWWFAWFGSTQRRLLQQTGILFRKQAMMPLEKVTDMNYKRSIMGNILGYGQFIMESAGQEQALREVNWVRYPDETHHAIIDTMFGPKPAQAAPHPPPPPPVELDGYDDDVINYSVDDWEAMSSHDEMPPSYPPRAHDAGHGAHPGSQPDGDVDTQVLDLRDADALKSVSWQQYRPDPDPYDD
ncbi:MAG: PH domain-containing protein [Micrococcales bacterium]|nr:PH domain-containing protein [Micrococcales bacterium]MCL2668233.1 PH domain-containing protein [Micrococcales bacterium]